MRAGFFAGGVFLETAIGAVICLGVGQTPPGWGEGAGEYEICQQVVKTIFRRFNISVTEWPFLEGWHLWLD